MCDILIRDYIRYRKSNYYYDDNYDEKLYLKVLQQICVDDIKAFKNTFKKAQEIINNVFLTKDYNYIFQFLYINFYKVSMLLNLKQDVTIDPYDYYNFSGSFYSEKQKIQKNFKELLQNKGYEGTASSSKTSKKNKIQKLKLYKIIKLCILHDANKIFRFILKEVSLYDSLIYNFKFNNTHIIMPVSDINSMLNMNKKQFFTKTIPCVFKRGGYLTNFVGMIHKQLEDPKISVKYIQKIKPFVLDFCKACLEHSINGNNIRWEKDAFMINGIEYYFSSNAYNGMKLLYNELETSREKDLLSSIFCYILN